MASSSPASPRFSARSAASSSARPWSAGRETRASTRRSARKAASASSKRPTRPSARAQTQQAPQGRRARDRRVGLRPLQRRLRSPPTDRRAGKRAPTEHAGRSPTWDRARRFLRDRDRLACVGELRLGPFRRGEAHAGELRSSARHQVAISAEGRRLRPLPHVRRGRALEQRRRTPARTRAGPPGARARRLREHERNDDDHRRNATTRQHASKHGPVRLPS